MGINKKHKNALIFGATGGIGQAIIKKMIPLGINLYLIGRSNDKLDALRAEYKIKSSQTFCTSAITSDVEFSKTAAWLEQLDISFDIGIHAAGVGLFKTAEKLELQEWRDIIDINLNSAFSFYKLFWNTRVKKAFDLVFFGSASVDDIWPKNSLYGASKSGLEMFAKALQKEVQRVGGRVWLYKPGSVDTSFFDRVKKHIPREKMIKSDLLANIVVNNLFLDHAVYFPTLQVLSD